MVGCSCLHQIYLYKFTNVNRGALRFRVKVGAWRSLSLKPSCHQWLSAVPQNYPWPIEVSFHLLLNSLHKYGHIEVTASHKGHWRGCEGADSAQSGQMITGTWQSSKVQVDAWCWTRILLPSALENGLATTVWVHSGLAFGNAVCTKHSCILPLGSTWNDHGTDPKASCKRNTCFPPGHTVPQTNPQVGD